MYQYFSGYHVIILINCLKT